MQILYKFKRDFDAGFKDFVKSLDILPAQATNELIFNGMLEDPVYLKWALVNKLSFDYLFKLSNKDLLKVFHSIKNSDLVFLHALKNHSKEDDFIKSNLPQFIRGQYLSNRETEKITIAMQSEARKTIMITLYDLMNMGEIDSCEWKLPPAEILSGISHTIDRGGNYRQYFEDEILAIQGRLDEKGRRTGTWTSFYPSGSIHSEGAYSAGQKNGEWCFFYLNGNLKSCGIYYGNMKNGGWQVFDSNNNVKMINYINGKVF